MTENVNVFVLSSDRFCCAGACVCVVICEGVYNCVLYMCERTHIADYSLYRIDACIFLYIGTFATCSDNTFVRTYFCS